MENKKNFLQSITGKFAQGTEDKNFNTINTEKKVVEINKDYLIKNMVCDLGASYYKIVGYDNTLFDFYNSYREIDADEVMNEEMAVHIADKTFKISDKLVSSKTDKSKKNHVYTTIYAVLSILEEYKKKGIKFEIGKDGILDIYITILLPADQLRMKNNIKSQFEGKVFKNCRLDLATGVNYDLRINVTHVFEEGRYSFKCLSKNQTKGYENIIIANIGYSTTDISLYEFNHDRKAWRRSRNIVSDYASKVFLKNLKGTIKSLGKEVKNAKEVERVMLSGDSKITRHRDVIFNMMNSLDEMIIDADDMFSYVPDNCLLVFCGGTSVMMNQAIKKYFKDNKEYYNNCDVDFIHCSSKFYNKDKVKRENVKINRFSDALGSYMELMNQLKIEANKKGRRR